MNVIGGGLLGAYKISEITVPVPFGYVYNNNKHM